MAAARVLYVGEDICHRIPVMERTGIVVLQSDCSVDDVRRSFAEGELLSAVTFHNDLAPPAKTVVHAAREFSSAPLILFENPSVECDDQMFDLIIPVPTPPDVWLKSLKAALAASRKIHEHSRRLRADCAAVRDWSQHLRETSARNRVSPIDYDALFRSECDDTDE